MSLPKQQQTDLLLGLIPTDQLEPHQKAKYRKNNTWPTHRLLREPKDIDEFISYRPGVAIWRDNGTLSYLTPSGRGPTVNQTQKNLRLGLGIHIACTIVGNTDEAIVETAEYFWNLKSRDAGDSHVQLAIGASNSEFDFSMIQPDLLARVLDIDPKGTMKFSDVTLSRAQSVTLATRPYPVDFLWLNSLRFEDNGNAFVDALQSRQSSFGKLELNGYNDYSNGQLCFDGTVLQRLFQTDTIEKLQISGSMDDHDLVLSLFSSPINAISWARNKPNWNSQKVEILHGNKVTLRLSVYSNFPDDSVFSSLFQYLGHMDITHLSVCIYTPNIQIPEQLLQELFRFIASKKNLLELSWKIDMESVQLLKDLLSVLEHHKTLRTLKIARYYCRLDPDYSLLIETMARNRNIVVRAHDPLSGWFHRFQNGPGSKIVTVNRCFRGSASLGQVSESIRPTLVGTSLMNSATKNFQLSALVLAGHTDALCQLLQDGEALSGGDPIDLQGSANFKENAPLAQKKNAKRKAKHQPQGAAKKERQRTGKPRNTKRA